MSTDLTGGGKYVPEDIRFQTLYKLFFRSFSKTSMDTPSTPAAPLLAATRLYASPTSQGVGKVRNVGSTCGDGSQRPGSGPRACSVAHCLQGHGSPPRPGQRGLAVRCQRYADTRRGTAMFLQEHPRSSGAWLATLPTPCPTSCFGISNDLVVWPDLPT